MGMAGCFTSEAEAFFVLGFVIPATITVSANILKIVFMCDFTLGNFNLLLILSLLWISVKFVEICQPIL